MSRRVLSAIIGDRARTAAAGAGAAAALGLATMVHGSAAQVRADGRKADERAQKSPAPSQVPPGYSRLVFTGSGNSTGTPRPACLMQLLDDERCRVSQMAMEGPPEENPNYRGNPSLLIQYAPRDGGRTRNIQIDIGKTYRESALRWYPRYGVPYLDAVIITHDHADACMGLDELRTVQRIPPNIGFGGLAHAGGQMEALPVFVGKRHMPRIAACFPYLMQKIGTVARYVAKIEWNEVADYETFRCPGGLDVTTVPVQHGKDYVCQAFVFGETQRVAYLSDITEVPPRTMEVLEQRPIDLLVVDCLFEQTHPVHFGIEDALALCRRLKPARTLFVGMSDQFEHSSTNERLRKLLREEALDVQLARDGLSVDLKL